MLKKFHYGPPNNEYPEALQFARDFCASHDTTVWVATCHIRKVVVVCTPAHRFPGMKTGTVYNPGCGVWFGGWSSLEETAEIPDEAEALPGRGEYWAALISGYSQGYSLEQIRRMAIRCDQEGTCVWHECARESGRLDKCQCGTCEEALS